MNPGHDEILLLDCTLRDGGFYTDWDFDRAFASSYAASADAAGVDVIEVGYRSLKRTGYQGPYKYCSPWLLEQLPPLSNTRVSVMVDGKELEGREEAVGETFRPAEASRVSLVRVATRIGKLDSVVEQVSRLRDLGYQTTINLMAFGNLSEKQAREALQKMDTSRADALYVADSYGTMVPEDVEAVVELCRGQTDRPLGLHLHNNLELAFANALRGMKLGVRRIDASVMGMGRGAGNLKTELLVQHLQSRLKVPGYRTEPLHEFIEDRMRPLKERHRWGSSSPYVLSGYLGVHPYYAQVLIESDRYTVQEVTSILQTIHDSGDAGSYSRDVLDEAISIRSRRTQVYTGSGGDAEELDDLRDQDWSEREVVVVGRGPSAYRHEAGINEYLARRGPVVIECNHLPGIEATDEHYCAFLVLANALSLAGPALEADKQVVIGFRDLPAELALNLQDVRDRAYFEPYEVRQGALSVRDPVLPADVVSMYAIALALRQGARRFRLVGFDGYADSREERDRRMQAEMLEFFDLLAEQHPGVEVKSLLPTSYGVPVESLYGALFHDGGGAGA